MLTPIQRAVVAPSQQVSPLLQKKSSIFVNAKKLPNNLTHFFRTVSKKSKVGQYARLYISLQTLQFYSIIIRICIN